MQMTENTEAGTSNPDNDGKIATESLPEGNNSPEKQQTTNITQEETLYPDKTEPIESTQETEHMEVHHHPDLHHKPKPWKEYFLEFIMIFCAVTLGFFAENMREHYAENKKAKEYAQSLYDDLKIDTFVLQRTFNEKNWIFAKYDNALRILESAEQGNNNEFLYYIERYVTFNDVFTSQDVTYQQLRSSGNFRYIRNVSLYKNIADYYNLYTRYQSVDGSLGLNGREQMADLEAKIFNVKDLASLDNDNATTFYDLAKRPSGKFVQIKTDKQNLALLYIKIANARNRTTASKLFLNWLKEKATILMTDLKKEYEVH
jgi:hypothetical protein